MDLEMVHFWEITKNVRGAAGAVAATALFLTLS